MINNKKIYGVLLILLFAGCQSVNHEINQPQADGNPNNANSVPSYTFDDVFGEHNPLMIAGWGGEKTHEEWFLRCTRQSPRLMLLDSALRNYYSRHFEFPESWQALDESGYFPLRSIDPITAKPFCFTKAPEANDDFINMQVEATSAKWVITGQALRFPSSEYFPYTWDYSVEDEFMVGTASQDYESFPSNYAMKGFNFATAVNFVLWDYEHRRAEMPETSEQLLDSLWYAANEWAVNDPTFDYTQPGGFMFGIDQGLGISVAVWHDEAGRAYVESYRWDPWPDGWQEVPTAGGDGGLHGVPWYTADPDFVPETLLWTCNLGD